MRINAATLEEILATLLYMTLCKGLGHENLKDSNFIIIYRLNCRFELSTLVFQVHPHRQNEVKKAKKAVNLTLSA